MNVLLKTDPAMSNRRFDSLVGLAAAFIICGLPAVLAADETQPASADKAAWGSVTGRVVFEGDMADPLLDRFRGELPVYAGRRTQRAAAGLEPDNPNAVRQVGIEINRKLIIDKSTRGIKNAFVYLRKAPETVHPRYTEKELEDASIVSRHTRYIPRASVVRLGQTVQLKNLSPNQITNFNLSPVRSVAVNYLLKPLKHSEWTPQRAERFPIRIQNDLQPMAKAWLLILDHPYAAVTAADGTFTIPDLPVGKHRLTVWHETMGYVEKFVDVTVEAGKTTSIPNCKLTLEKLRKKHQP
ncbi:carboxypeptidase-like regulatory domain-containing protein [Symmachiella dynata]|uniref:carboxypeptidase-like regulatory domain-containing protein n=1 Tax=Symmachiella dynata TaxID=2527995 RepID=UPI0030ED8B79